jgi:hypothetical protein
MPASNMTGIRHFCTLSSFATIVGIFNRLLRARLRASFISQDLVQSQCSSHKYRRLSLVYCSFETRIPRTSEPLKIPRYYCFQHAGVAVGKHLQAQARPRQTGIIDAGSTTPSHALVKQQPTAWLPASHDHRESPRSSGSDAECACIMLSYLEQQVPTKSNSVRSPSNVMSCF